jgi:hypothetical protein
VNRLPLRNLVAARFANNKRAESLDFTRLLPSLTSGNFHYVLTASTHYGKLENRLSESSQGFESLTLRQIKASKLSGLLAFLFSQARHFAGHFMPFIRRKIAPPLPYRCYNPPKPT